MSPPEARAPRRTPARNQRKIKIAEKLQISMKHFLFFFSLVASFVNILPTFGLVIPIPL
jgi:hypothetical protein